MSWPWSITSACQRAVVTAKCGILWVHFYNPSVLYRFPTKELTWNDRSLWISADRANSFIISNSSQTTEVCSHSSLLLILNDEVCYGELCWAFGKQQSCALTCKSYLSCLGVPFLWGFPGINSLLGLSCFIFTTTLLVSFYSLFLSLFSKRQNFSFVPFDACSNPVKTSNSLGTNTISRV